MAKKKKEPKPAPVDNRKRWRIDDSPAFDICARPRSTDGGAALVAEYAALMQQAAREVEEQFSRAEWNLMADALNGCFDLYNLTGNHSYRMMLVAEANDAHTLNRLGDKWLGINNKADTDDAVADLVRRLDALSPLHAAAVVASVRWFWMHATDGTINHTTDHWWRVGFRLLRTKEGA